MAFLVEALGVQAAHGEHIAAPPVTTAYEAAIQVWAAALRGALPKLIELADLTTPVHLVKAKAALDTTILNVL